MSLVGTRPPTLDEWEKAFSVDVSKVAGSRYAVLGFDASGKKIVDSGWQTGKTYALGKDVASYRLLFS